MLADRIKRLEDTTRQVKHTTARAGFNSKGSLMASMTSYLQKKVARPYAWSSGFRDTSHGVRFASHGRPDKYGFVYWQTKYRPAAPAMYASPRPQR
jgi:hypothetical protein